MEKVHPGAGSVKQSSGGLAFHVSPTLRVSSEGMALMRVEPRVKPSLCDEETVSFIYFSIGNPIEK